MNLTRVFHSSSINWEILPELSARLAHHNVTLEKASVTLDSFPDSIEIESLEAAREKVRTGFQPLTYKLTLQCKQDDSLVVISIARTWQVQSGFAQAFCLFGSIDETLLISVADFLGLQRFVLESHLLHALGRYSLLTDLTNLAHLVRTRRRASLNYWDFALPQDADMLRSRLPGKSACGCCLRLSL